jgi:hypothetical protein
VKANSEVPIEGMLGILKLFLGEGDYAWQFVSVPGGAIEDSGSGSCH